MSREPKYHPSYAEKLIEHMKGGHTLASFAFTINVSRSTLYNWLQIYPDFKDAFEIGYSASLYYHEVLLNEGMKGTCSNIEGSKGVNANLLTFALKTRFKTEYSEQAEIPLFELAKDESDIFGDKPIHEITREEIEEKSEELKKHLQERMEMFLTIMYSPDPFTDPL